MPVSELLSFISHCMHCSVEWFLDWNL